MLIKRTIKLVKIYKASRIYRRDVQGETYKTYKKRRIYEYLYTYVQYVYRVGDRTHSFICCSTITID